MGSSLFSLRKNMFLLRLKNVDANNLHCDIRELLNIIVFPFL